MRSINNIVRPSDIEHACLKALAQAWDQGHITTKQYQYIRELMDQCVQHELDKEK